MSAVNFSQNPQSIWLDDESEVLYIEHAEIQIEGAAILFEGKDESEMAEVLETLIAKGAEEFSTSKGLELLDQVQRTEDKLQEVVEDIQEDMDENLKEAFDRYLGIEGSENAAINKTLQSAVQSIKEAFEPHIKKLDRRFDSDRKDGYVEQIHKVFDDCMKDIREELSDPTEKSHPLHSYIEQQSKWREEIDKRLSVFEEDVRKELRGIRSASDEDQGRKSAESEAPAGGRSFEEEVFQALCDIPQPMGDSIEDTRNEQGAVGKMGDAVVDVFDSNSNMESRIAVEMKDQDGLPRKPKTLFKNILDPAQENRDADAAILVTKHKSQLPSGAKGFKVYRGPRAVVAFDPEEDSPVLLEAAYSVIRHLVLAEKDNRSSKDEIDFKAMQDDIEKIEQKSRDLTNVKRNLTSAKKSISSVYDTVGEIQSELEEKIKAIRSHFNG